MRVAIVCEGSTDFVVLTAIAEAVIQADECVLLQPDFDMLQRDDPDKIASGWQGVRRFLRENIAALSLPVYDVVLIQVDASIRNLDEIRPKLTPPADPDEPLQPLCDHVKSWAGRALPASVVITLPREDLEAWVVAAMLKRKAVEGIDRPVDVLVRAGLLAEKNGKPHKTDEQYKKFAPAVGRLARDNRKLRDIRELERTVDKLRRRARTLRSA